MIAVLIAATLSASAPLVAGTETVLTFADDAGEPVVGATIAVVQRPGLPSEKETGAGITDSQGRVRWKPELPGPALVFAGEDAVGAVHVAWAIPPVSTLVPLGLLLVAGLAAAVYGAGPRRRRS